MRKMVNMLTATLGLITLCVEGLIWPPARALGRLLWSFSIFGAFEDLVSRMPPRVVVAAFFFPMCCVAISLKFGEFWLFEHGHFAIAVLAALLMKIWGLSFSARLFEIARPKMLEVETFRRFYCAANRARNWLMSLEGCRRARFEYRLIRRALRHGLWRLECLWSGRGFPTRNP